MIDFGLDESIDKRPTAKRLLVVAAHAGITTNMKKMSAKWEKDLGRLPYFHAKDLWEEDSSLYRGMSMRKRDQLLSKLVSHVHRYPKWGVIASIDELDYNARTTPRFRSQSGSAYTHAVIMALLEFYFMLDREGLNKTPVNILIEEGHKNGKQALAAIERIQSLPSPILNIKSYGFGKKEGHPILQSADALAYGSLQKIKGSPDRIFKKLTSTKRPVYRHVDCGKRLDSMLSGYAEYVARLHEENRRKHFAKTDSAILLMT